MITVRGGAFCSPPGATGITSAGNTVECALAAGGRNRWMKPDGGTSVAAGTPAGNRRGLLAQLRKLGVKVRRGTPDETLQEMIDAEKARLAGQPEPVTPQPEAPPVEAPPVEAPPALSAADRVQQAIAAINPEQHATIHLADIRDQLPDLSREEFDRAILDLQAKDQLQLDEEPFGWRIDQRAKDAAITFGGAACHDIILKKDLPASVRGVAPKVVAPPLSSEWRRQKAALFEYQHPQNPAQGIGAKPSIEEIRAAHTAAVKAGGGDPHSEDGAWAGVAAVRRHLPKGYSREAVDRALQEADRSGAAWVAPEPNQKVLLDLDREGAVEIGNQPNHLIKIREPRV